jgi:hypothetical protein
MSTTVAPVSGAGGPGVGSPDHPAELIIVSSHRHLDRRRARFGVVSSAACGLPTILRISRRVAPGKFALSERGVAR